jgi:hypothetical protein
LWSAKHYLSALVHPYQIKRRFPIIIAALAVGPQKKILW